MTPIYHIAISGDWEAARPTGRYEVSTRGATLTEVGFIHCSLRAQLRGVADFWYADRDDLVLLVIDPSLLDAPVRFEQGYPHVYGALPVRAVVEVRPITRTADGRFDLPE